MFRNITNTQELLDFGISGYHRYVLNEPAHIIHASQDLCDMLGCDKQELESEKTDLYLNNFVHPADRAAYTEFLEKITESPQRLTSEYRIVRKDGEVRYVTDSFTASFLEDGTVVGHSVLSDVTKIKKENDSLRFLSETVPCGFLKYSCDKQPKITYINDQMLKMLRFPGLREGETDYLELYKENIYLLIPIEERQRFSLYLEKVAEKGEPLAGEMTLLRFDGSKCHVFGWVTKIIKEDGSEEFQSACMDVTERYRQKKEQETEKYLKALTDVYDKIFEYDLSKGTVKCLHSHGSPSFRHLENIAMEMEEATEKWITGAAAPEDQAAVREYFHSFFERRFAEVDGKPPQIAYKALSSDGTLRSYSGLFLKIDPNTSLFCCRNMPSAKETEPQEDLTLRTMKENMQELVMRFTEGLAAFEVKDGCVTPLYASDNVCKFFGFTKEEWLPMMKRSTPIGDFVARSQAAYSEFITLLENGEAEFTYYDLESRCERRIKAICSRKSPSGSAPRYIMLYNMGSQAETPPPKVYIRTFGYFDVFVEGKPIAFRNEKSKELFALLVDRRGGFVSSDEAISFLWEDESANTVTLARYRKVALRLKNILEEYGISDVIESVGGKRRLVVEQVGCDLYDYLSGKPEHAQLFKGSYLSNYSWGEVTLAELSTENI